MTIRVFIFGFLMVFGLTILGAQSYSYSNYLPTVEKTADALVVSIDTLNAKKEFYIYYKTPGLKKFQVRKMESGKDGKVYYRLSTATLYGKKLEYFIVENGKSVSDSITPIFTVDGFTNKKSPDIYFMDDGGGGSASTPKEPIINVEASASATAQIHDGSDFPGEKFDANGNLRVYKNISNEKMQFDFNSEVTYTHNPGEDESEFNLSNMKIAFKKGVHSIEAGDVSIDNTDYTTSSLSMRGLSYVMDGKSLYLSSFFTNSQQKTGFEGFGIPPSDAFYFGASAGFNLGTTLKVRGMFMTGKDNLDSKTVVSMDEAYREGSVYSVWGQLDLFQNHLQLKGEFSRSNFGKAPDKSSLAKESDTAWRTEADFNYGVFTAHADYKKVGDKFSSIANLFLENDWEGLAGNAGVSVGTFALTVNYTDKQTNLTSQIQEALHTKNIGAEMNWLVANHVKLGGSFSLDNLDYDESSGLQTGSEDMDTIRYSATLGYVAGNNGITFQAGKTESKTFTSNIDAKVMVNLMLGKFFSLNPSLSYQSTENFSDDSTSKIYSVFVDSKFHLVQEILSFAVTGSWTKTDNTYSDTTLLSVDGDLNLNLSKVFKYKFNPSVSLKGKYEESKNDSDSNSFVTLYLQANLSF